MFQTYNKETASATDRAAWALFQIIYDDAPLRWARYRGIVECISHNKNLIVAIGLSEGLGVLVEDKENNDELETRNKAQRGRRNGNRRLAGLGAQ